jgi:UDP:flavonoid glycosyltransferase YjiC (YdhE family)
VTHILIVTVGTTGDVVPFVALGTGLRGAGHRVTVATHPSLREHIDRAGLGFAALPVEFGPTGPDTPPLTSTRFARILAGRWLDIGRAVAGAATDADLIVTAAMGWIGYHVAQARGIPSIGAFLQPLEPTAAFPPPMVTTRSLGGWGNRTAARWFRVLGQAPFARATARLRRELGLPPMSPAATFRRMDRERWPVLHGFSPAVVPTPPDWPEHRPATGYWWPPATGRLSPALRRFLDDGDPPVFIGFGSMCSPGLGAVVERAVARLGRRVVVQAGTAGLSVTGRDILVVGAEPHAELFPRVAVAVHHAGAGTTAAALRAGVPAVCVPVTADQPFWAARVSALGAGPPPLPARRLTPDRLVAAVHAAADFSGGAQRTARRLSTEDGVGRAVAEIQRIQ